MNKNTYIAFLFVFFFIQKAANQDIHFSQFQQFPLLNNPGNTGIFEGDFRFSNNYRNQWQRISRAFQTFGISYDQPTHFFGQDFATGIVVLYDQAGGKQLLTNKIHLSLAYHKFIGVNQFSTGIQGGLVLRELDYANLSFLSQYDDALYEFSMNLPTNETGLNDRSTYFDLNWGLVWRRKTNRFFPSAGVSIYHFNVPQLRFIDNNEWPTLKPRVQVFGSMLMEVSPAWHVVPALYYAQQGKTSDFMAGSDFLLFPHLSFIDINNVNVGMYFRSNLIYNFDAVIVKTGIKKNKWEVGVSYDVSLSKLRKSSVLVGAFEISVIYIGLTKKDENFVPCVIM